MLEDEFEYFIRTTYQQDFASMTAKYPGQAIELLWPEQWTAFQYMSEKFNELLAANTDLDRQRNQYRDNAATYKKRNDLARSLIASHEKHHLSPPEVTLKAVDRALQAYGEPLNHEYASLRT